MGRFEADFKYTGSLQNGDFATPYKTLAAGTNAVLSGGTIAINASVQPPVAKVTGRNHETIRAHEDNFREWPIRHWPLIFPHQSYL